MKRIGLTIGLALIAWLFAASVTPVAARDTALICEVTNATSMATFGDLQSAVNDATAGDTLRVKGVCYGGTNIGKSVQIVGMPSGTRPGAILHGNGALTVNITAGTVTFTRILVTGGAVGDAALAGGVVAGPFTTVTFNWSIIAENSSTLGAGGLFNLGANVTFNNSWVVRNTGADGGAIITSCNIGGSLTLNNTAIRNNEAGSGGGIFIQSCPVTFNNSTVSDNTATDEGGGLTVYNSAIELNGTSVVNNVSAVDGGGLFGFNSTATYDASSVVSGNLPNDCSGISCP